MLETQHIEQTPNSGSMRKALPSDPPSGDEQLGAAASAGATDVAKSLVTSGADVNASRDDGMTPVMLAVVAGHLDTAVQLALSSGADLTRVDTAGRSALAHAISASNREVPLPPPAPFKLASSCNRALAKCLPGNPHHGGGYSLRVVRSPPSQMELPRVQASLALLLISTAKFTKPLHPLLPPALLLRLQLWVLDKVGKNDKAAMLVRASHCSTPNLIW